MEDVYLIARQIKEKIDRIVDDYGKDAIEPLKDVSKLNSWDILKGQSSGTILICMEIYLASCEWETPHSLEVG